MDFLSEQQIYYTSKLYEPIYTHMNTEYGIKYHELFILCASLGYRLNRKSEIKEKGREFRSNYFNTKHKASIYSMILNDPVLGKNIEKFNEKEFMNESRKIMEQFAEGGMDIICSELFLNKWQPPILDTGYDNYDIDLIKFVLEKSDEVPF